MKTSTAFAILAVLAAGTNAIPISRREEECACELLDPSKAADNVHTIHNDGSDLLPASQNSNPLIDIGASLLGSKQSSPSNGVDTLTNPVVDGVAPVTEDKGAFLNNGSPLLLSKPTEAEPTSDDDDTFNNNGGAFRPTRPAQTSSTNEAPSDTTEGDMAQEDGALQAIDGTSSEGLDGLVAQEPVSDKLDPLTNGDGVDNLLQSGDAVNDAILDPNTQVDTLSYQPVGQTVDNISPGTGTQATDAANGPLSNAADSVVPGTGDAANGPISNAADGVVPGTGDKVDEALASPVSDSAETILPGTGSTVNDAANGPATTVVDPILPGTSSTVSDAANGPTSSVADPILPDTGSQLTDATSSTPDEVVDGVIPGTGPTVKDAANSPVKDTADTVLPGTGPVVNDAVNNPVSQTVNDHLSSDHLGDHLDGHHIEQIGDHSGHLQSLGADKVLSGLQPQAQSNDSPSGNSLGSLTQSIPLTNKVNDAGQLLAASLGSNLLSGQPLQNLGGSLGGLATPLSNLGGVVPNSDSLTSGGGLAINLSGAIGVSSTGGDPASGVLSSSNGSPLGSTLNGLNMGGLKDATSGSGPLSSGGDIVKPLTSGGLLPSSGDSPLKTLTSGGLPLLSGVGLPSGSSASPFGNTLSNGLPASSSLGSLPSTQGSPIIPSNTKDQVGNIISPSSTDSITDSPVINTLSLPEDDSTITDNEFFGAGNQLLGKTKAGPVASDVEDDVNDTCIDCAEAIAKPTTNRVDKAKEEIKSDPLALKPLASDTAAPVVCATAPVTSMPAYTFPCLTNFDGSVGTMADMCISSTMVDSRPAPTFVCPEEMQDFTPDDLSLFRRGHHDEKFDLLGRTVGNFVRLCIISNDL